MTHLATVAAATALGAEWMRSPGWLITMALVWLALVAAVVYRRWVLFTSPRGLYLAGTLILAGLAAAAVEGTRRLARVTASWPSEREAVIDQASRRLGGELDAAVAMARRLARRAAASLPAGPPAERFRALEAVLERDGPMHGVVAFDPTGRPVAWAGPQRVALNASGPELEAVTTPFYLWLVARRQENGGTAAAALLLARAPGVPATGPAVAERFAARTGVGLRFLDPRAAPADSDLFDYVLPPGTAAADTLFAVGPVPPDQGAARAERLMSARRLAVWLTGLLLLVALAAAAREPWPPVVKALFVGVALLALARAPLKEAFGPDSVFWPDTYYQGLLGPYSASVGALALLGLLVATAGCALWRLGPKPALAIRVIAVLGTVLAPYLLQDLARGITPPAGGVPVALWLVWQSALTLSAAAIVLPAAALVRGSEVPRHAGAWPYAAGAIAVGAAVYGLWLWRPQGAWPVWYAYLWAPALLIAIRPMPFRATVATVAVVAGSAAALLTWRATAEGRMALARRDLESLGDRTDPLAVALLDRLVHELPLDDVPQSEADLYLLWRNSALGAQGYPAALAVWSGGGELLRSLELAQLDLSADQVGGVAREALQDGLPLVRPVLQPPGLHGIVAFPFLSGQVLTVAVGPRSRLVAPTRVGHFLVGRGREPEPPFEVALAPSPSVTGQPGVVWRRERWLLRAERALDLPGGARHVHALVDLRGPSSLLQRGGLVLVFDVLLLAALWLLAEAIGGHWLPAARDWLRRARRSLRLRLTVSLALFFVAPALGFAAWSYSKLEEEFRGARALLLQRTLRDAAAVLGDSARPLDVALRAAARQFDTPLSLARGGRITSTSVPVLLELGLLDLRVSGSAYSRLAYGDHVDASVDQEASPLPTLVGYRLLGRRGQETVMLAAPEFLSDPALTRREADLGIAVMVATATGVLAALILSGLAARALAEPMQQLRRAALAVGSGQIPELDGAAMPAELEPIAGALAQAAADVEKGQRAQRVLAWGEMARQVAHEIKNPLTPIRLGIQHLLRVRRERPADLEPVLDGTSERIIAEIDRLDAIARAFSRFALPSGEALPVEPVDVASVVRDVVHLYRMGESPVSWEQEVRDGLRALARRDELVEVLVNLCENARDAEARRVVVSGEAREDRVRIEVRDDGRGIPPEVLPRIFEPRFSTTTSGSGLGLAIAKRLVESWGGSIVAIPVEGGGTLVRIELPGK